MLAVNYPRPHGRVSDVKRLTLFNMTTTLKTQIKPIIRGPVAQHGIRAAAF